MLFKTLLLILSLLTCPSISQAKIIFRAAYENASQYPNYVGDTSEIVKPKPGVAVELVKRLENHIPDFKVELFRFPWKQCLLLLKEGELDGIFNGSFSQQRLKVGTYPWKDGSVDTSRRLTTMSYHFYRLKDSKFNWDGHSVSGLTGKIGTPIAFSIEADLKKMGLPILSARDIQVNFSNLLRGKVDALALQDVTGDFHIRRKSGLNSIEKVLPALKTKPYYLMLSKQFKNKHPELAEKIWNTIAILREEKLQELLQGYY